MRSEGVKKRNESTKKENEEIEGNYTVCGSQFVCVCLFVRFVKRVKPTMGGGGEAIKKTKVKKESKHEMKGM